MSARETEDLQLKIKTVMFIILVFQFYSHDQGHFSLLSSETFNGLKW